MIKIILTLFSILLIPLNGCAQSNQDGVTQAVTDSVQQTQLFISNLIDANQISQLCLNHDTVRIVESSLHGYSTDDYLLYQGKIANSHVYYYEDAKMSQTFYYDCFNVHLIENEVEASFYIEQALSQDSWLNCETNLSRYFENTVIEITEEDNKSYTLMVQQTADTCYEIIVDKTSLEIQSIDFVSDNHHIEVLYGQDFEGMQLIDDLEGDLKQVEIIADLYFENSAYHFTQTFSVPVHWELRPACLDLYNLYSDVFCETPYIYPGDNIDYFVYLSNARG